MAIPPSNENSYKLQDNGDLIIYDDNVTEVIWTSPKNGSAQCIATGLEISNSGILSLKCNDGTVTWSKSI